MTTPPTEKASASDAPKRPFFLITHEFHPRHGGIATFSEEMARAVAGLGMDVEVWAQTPHLARSEPIWPFRLRRLPLKGTHDLSCQARLMKELIQERRRLRHATVYLPEPGPMLAMMMLQHFHAFCPKRLILTFHGSEILRFHRNPTYRHLAGALIKKAWRVSTLTHYTSELLCHHFPDAQGKVILTPGALRSGMTAVASPTHAQGKKVVVLTVARLHPRKGQLETLGALQKLPAGLRNKTEYWVVGGGNKGGYADKLREQAAAGDVKVRFYGDVSDEELSKLYSKADLFAMTSVEHGSSVEGFGLVYLEAAAHGLPVIGHRVGGVAEAVRAGTTGLLVDPEHPDQLVEAFRTLISSEEKRHRLGQAGRAWARTNTWTASAQALLT